VFLFLGKGLGVGAGRDQLCRHTTVRLYLLPDNLFTCDKRLAGLTEIAFAAFCADRHFAIANGAVGIHVNVVMLCFVIAGFAENLDVTIGIFSDHFIVALTADSSFHIGLLNMNV
jgi:hypothetical protein